jgi:hypothetical protein
MSFYSVVICVVKPQKQEEFVTLLQKYIKYSEKFKEVKSFKVFNQIFSIGVYILIWEYLSFEEFENVYKRLLKDEEGNKIWQEIINLTDYSNFNLWNATNITSVWEMNR